ncbi:bifunctional [glutamine synthetase] adenylyltransferase/[glutamine synthetase]-adenylyl-L-tyrosine phosphorylase [Acuticoccus sp.]|uniref:bifunctional [glutamine synthetase] adenylyltransferase/[glutamine synthetase]-adenylyl-L-tyrosine phosphorylase n=1 Tax=Acuticoccus sp. TaxID=1904378 RepID=UPI003B51B57D
MSADAPLGATFVPLDGPGDRDFDAALGATRAAELPAGSRAALSTVAAVSPYLKHAMLRGADDLAGLLAQPLGATVAKARVAPSGDVSDVGARLRRAKGRVALAVALADLLGGADVATVTEALSAVADEAIATALASVLLAAAVKGVAPEPETSGLVVLALGKLGGEELNFSSDVDLVVLFDPDRAEPAGIDGKQAVRLIQAMTRVLQARTGDGYVFRVDLRLRPDPGATPVAMSTRAAVAYFQNRARAWERQAMIKARQVAGDRAAGNAYLRALEPTVWRLAYDFTVIDDTMAMRDQIAAVRGAGALTLPGHNVKLGRGGIREIEFFVQSLQRIAGGRDRALRGRRTVEMLEALAARGWIAREPSDELTAAYERLRRVEHRLQMVDDAQTHVLPAAEGLPRLARMMRLADFEEEMLATLERVHLHFASLTGVVGQTNPLLAPVAVGFPVPTPVAEAFAAAMDGWTAGRHAGLKGERSRRLLRAVEPDLRHAVASSADPEATIAALDDFLARLPASVELLARLDRHRELIAALVLIVSTSPRLATELARRTHLLDVLIDPQFFGRLAEPDVWATQLQELVAREADYEAKLDIMRTFGQEQALLIDVRVLTSSLSGPEASRAMTDLADVAVDRALEVAREAFEVRHGRLAGGGVALLALGKFGGQEMTATSDLDVVFLYDCDADAGESDGAKGLSPGHYYTRLAQRFIAALAAPTARGTLYEVDLRLRPSGRAGPLATHIRSFARYHAESAWTWEHMALTRARIVAGDARLAAQAMAVIHEALSRDREREELGREIAAMRARMAAQSEAGLKLMAGGQVDIEFIAQHAVLSRGLFAPADTGTVAMLERARDHGTLPADACETLTGTYAFYQRLAQLLSIASEGSLTVADAPAALQRLLVRAGEAPDLAFLEADIAERRSTVRTLFEQLVGPVGPV